MQVMDSKGRTQRAPRVSGCGLYPDIFERALSEQPPVCHTVQGHPARHAKIRKPGLPVETVAEPEHDVLKHVLERTGNVHLLPGHFGLWLSWRAIKESVEPAVGHREAGTVIEVVHVQPERAVVLDVYQIVQYLLCVQRAAVGCKSHDLVLAGIYPEPGVIGKRGIQKSQRVGESHLPQRCYGVVSARPCGGRCPFPDTVHTQYGRFIER